MIWVKSMNLMSDVITKMLGPRITADTGEWGTYEWNEHLLGAPGLLHSWRVRRDSAQYRW